MVGIHQAFLTEEVRQIGAVSYKMLLGARFLGTQFFLTVNKVRK